MIRPALWDLHLGKCKLAVIWVILICISESTGDEDRKSLDLQMAVRYNEESGDQDNEDFASGLATGK